MGTRKKFDPSTPDATARAVGNHNLVLRVGSALVLAPIALGAAYLGGWPFVLFWTVVCGAVFYEWVTLVLARDENAQRPAAAMLVVWTGFGLVYAVLVLAATLTLRFDAGYGLVAILFVFAVVWFTDIAAYFSGRALGGPRLVPAISPAKTWSGAAGGVVGGIAAGLVIAALGGIGNLFAAATVALVLSTVAQFGDIFESAIKRRFRAKDSSALIPGHGGVMDRIDSFATAVICAAAIGIARGGFDEAASGLLVW